jgi:hypothetical protein
MGHQAGCHQSVDCLDYTLQAVVSRHVASDPDESIAVAAVEYRARLLDPGMPDKVCHKGKPRLADQRMSTLVVEIKGALDRNRVGKLQCRTVRLIAGSQPR